LSTHPTHTFDEFSTAFLEQELPSLVPLLMLPPTHLKKNIAQTPDQTVSLLRNLAQFVVLYAAHMESLPDDDDDA
jgi:hypothetical protein